ncbi:MAG: beta-galactosidase [Verrucomicrobia bacterium]|nr:beta-galactosidase [Verrucomicrobiota bacterium]
MESVVGLLCALAPWAQATGASLPAAWQLGAPIVTYWAGPPMTDAAARQMAEGGWNLVWCRESELDVARRHGLRAQLYDPLLRPRTLDDPARRADLDALIERVKKHPALYAYFLRDEPNAADFPALGRMVAYLRERDPARLAYINLFPTYANNRQLGTQGETVAAYKAYLRRYLTVVKPALLSYDHYQFATRGDTPQYFLNLALIRQAALKAGIPFLNIVQACSWTPSMRVPQPDEMRYLVYTTLAYGAQGISYYVYSHRGHTGGIARADGSPTPLYHVLKTLNREFAAIASQLQPLRSLGVYHAGMLPPGTEPPPESLPFRPDPAPKQMEYKPPRPVRGVLIGCFGPLHGSRPTHALVVNLDYRRPIVQGLRGPGPWEIFDAASGRWKRASADRVELCLPPGGGRLARTAR